MLAFVWLTVLDTVQYGSTMQGQGRVAACMRHAYISASVRRHFGVCRVWLYGHCAGSEIMKFAGDLFLICLYVM